MRIGANFPWLDYGWDFGVPPPGARKDKDPNWLAQIDQALDLFVRIGVCVVRWFILADGLTYGSGNEAPRRDPSNGKWFFESPALSREFLSHFELLLKKFRDFNTKGKPSRSIQLIPVLIDHTFCLDGMYPVRKEGGVPDQQWVKQGRGQAINDGTKQAQFLQNVLQPLLRTAAPYSEVIFAWDIINEPEWVTNGWHTTKRSGLPVDEFAMRAFIEDSKSLISYSGLFNHTIGFATRKGMLKSGISADVNQFHYYSAPAQQEKLDAFDPKRPAFIGEFSTSTIKDVWPDLKSDEQSVLSRLRFAEQQGYQLALPWSFNPMNNFDPGTAWGPQVDADIECFVFKRNCPKT